jgi:hypothetical protein
MIDFKHYEVIEMVLEGGKCHLPHPFFFFF